MEGIIILVSPQNNPANATLQPTPSLENQTTQSLIKTPPFLQIPSPLISSTANHTTKIHILKLKQHGQLPRSRDHPPNVPTVVTHPHQYPHPLHSPKLRGSSPLHPSCDTHDAEDKPELHGLCISSRRGMVCGWCHLCSGKGIDSQPKLITWVSLEDACVQPWGLQISTTSCSSTTNSNTLTSKNDDFSQVVVKLGCESRVREETTNAKPRAMARFRTPSPPPTPCSESNRHYPKNDFLEQHQCVVGSTCKDSS